jgi:hypothetical protein
VTADESTNHRQHVIEVQLISAVDDRRSRRRKFENDKSPARLEHAMNFAQSRIEIGDIAYSKRYDRTCHRR